MSKLVIVKRLNGQSRQVDLDRCERGEFRVGGMPALVCAKTGLLTALYEGLGWYPHDPIMYRMVDSEGSPFVFISVVGSLVPRLTPHYFEVARQHVEELLALVNADEPTREYWLGAPAATTAALPDLVSLDQAAAAVHRGKRTLERRKTEGTLPPPASEGGGGKPDLWDWSTLRPWLEKEFGINLPQRFPGNLR